MKLKTKSLLISLGFFAFVFAFSAVGLLVGNKKSSTSTKTIDNEPVIINNEQAFISFYNELSNGNTFENTYISQKANLVLPDDYTLVSSNVAFNGMYLGNGHTISNLEIEKNASGDAALFPILNGEITNLGIENSLINGDLRAATFACHSDSDRSMILNCYSKATISGFSVGGIANEFNGTIISSFFDGTLNSEIKGGIAVSSRAIIDCVSPINVDFNRASHIFGRNKVEAISQANYDNFKKSNAEYNKNYSWLYKHYFSGNGTQNSPFLIRNFEDLSIFRDLVNSNFSFKEFYFEQTNNIDFTDTGTWLPIGEFGTSHVFCGTYNGAGHTLNSLKIDGGLDGNVGLFGVLNGTLINLGIESGEINGGCIGSFASHTFDEALIINCYSKASLKGYRVGGIVDNSSPSSIVNCLFAGTISGTEYGGIVGYNATRLINCSTVGYEPYNHNFDGKTYGNVKGYDSLKDATKAHNSSLYDGVNKTNYYHFTYYKVNESGSFSTRTHFTLRLLLKEFIVISIALVVGALCWFLIWRFKNKETKFNLSLVKEKCMVCKEKIIAPFKDEKNNRSKVMTIIAVVLFSLCGLLSILGIICGDFNVLLQPVFHNGEDTFMDLFNPARNMLIGVDGYNNIGGTYPPVARFFLWLFAKMLPTSVATLPTALEMRSQAISLIFVFILIILIITALAFALSNKGIGVGKKRYIIIALCLTPSFIYMIERGNILALSIVLSVLFVAGYRSENPLIRQLSYVCLGIASAIKIYPALLGLLVIREKKLSDIISALAWGVAFFFIPFVFYGGWTSLMQYFRNISGMAFEGASFDYTRIDYSSILRLLGETMFGSVSTFSSFIRFTKYPLIALLAVASIFTKKTWRSAFMLVTAIVLLPGVSYYYLAVFYFIPFMMLLKEEDSRRFDYVYLGLLLITVLPLQFLCGQFSVGKYIPIVIVGVVGIMSSYILLGDFVVTKSICLANKLTNKKKEA